MMALSRTYADCVGCLVMNATSPRYNTSAWMDTDVMINSARKAFQGVAVQAVLNHFSQEFNGTLNGSASWTEQRLILRTLSFWLVTSLLVMLIIIVAALCCQSSPLVVPRDPGSIAGLAAIVASSPDINSLLQGVAHSEDATKARLIALSPYRTDYSGVGEGHHFQISVPSIEASDDALVHSVSAQQQKWYVKICIRPLQLARRNMRAPGGFSSSTGTSCFASAMLNWSQRLKADRICLGGDLSMSHCSGRQPYSSFLLPESQLWRLSTNNRNVITDSQTFPWTGTHVTRGYTYQH
jgi:hypothetical protein